jgi:hypothetical protein
MTRGVLPLALASTLAGCAGIGPSTVARDRFDYSGAVATSWQKQMLLNMAKLRYADTPVFMDVASVVNQYSLQGEITLAGTVSDGISGDVGALGTRGRYEDRPTITYSPVRGEQFTRSILTPLPPGSIFSLIQAGWPVDLVFRLSVRAVNGIYGASGTTVQSREADPEFYHLIDAMRTVQLAGGMGMRIRGAQSPEGTLLFFRSTRAIQVEDEIEFVRNTLGLKRGAQTFNLVFGAFPTSDTEIALQTRSMLEIVSNLASTIDVPEQHVEERRTIKTFREKLDDGTKLSPLIHVHTTSDEPDDAFVAVPYRDIWFWIDDRDLASKRMFSFLLFMFSLAETGHVPSAPVVTISAGGGS